MGNFFCAIRDVVIAVLRLIMLQVLLLFTGLHHILFNQTEVSNVTLALVPQRRHRDRLAFIDGLRMYNLDLINNASMPPGGSVPFREDDYDDEDFDDFDEGDDDFPDDNGEGQK